MNIFNLLTTADQKLFEIVHVKKGQILFHEESLPFAFRKFILQAYHSKEEGRIGRP